MEIIKPNHKNFWLKVISALKKGKIIVFPTDTAYGLGADFFSAEANEKIFRIKKRPRSKKIALVAADPEQVKKYFKLRKTELILAKKYWPGPLTMVLSLKRKKLEVGVRVPGLKLAREICKKFGKPITSTSANVSGKPTPYSINEVIKQFKNKKYKPDLIIDGGRLKKVKPSTLVVYEKNKIKVLRKGPVIIH